MAGKSLDKNKAFINVKGQRLTLPFISMFNLRFFTSYNTVPSLLQVEVQLRVHWQTYH